jgi:hypothetical protein
VFEASTLALVEQVERSRSVPLLVDQGRLELPSPVASEGDAEGDRTA